MFKGVFTALVTPFCQDGRIDEEGLICLIHEQLSGGIDGLVVLGTTGEAPTLSDEEKRQVIEIAVKSVDGKIPILAGTGSNSTAVTIERTHLANLLGADAALIVAPYYNKPTQEGLYQHYLAIAEDSSIPIVVYNIPSRTGVNIKTDTLAKIADHPKIVGVKDASGNILQMMEVYETIRRKRKDFCILSGDDSLTLPMVSLGGDGVISVASNIIPGTLKEFVWDALKGDMESAREFHYKLLPLFHALFCETNPIPVKQALRDMGKPGGTCRLPLCEMNDANKRRLHSILEKVRTWCKEIPTSENYKPDTFFLKSTNENKSFCRPTPTQT